MKNIVAIVVASAFAFGAASTFAAPMAKEHVRVEHQVRHTQAPKFEKTHYAKKAHRHHVRRHHHRQF